MKDTRGVYMKSIKYKRGSITVEAAMVLPLFVCAVMSIVLIMKLIYTHEIIQHALDRSVNELAVYSYVYSASGQKSAADNAADELENAGQMAKGDVSLLVEEYNLINGIGESTSNIGSKDIGSIGDDVDDIAALIEETKDNTSKIEETIERISKDPVREVKSFICLAGSLMTHEANHQVSKYTSAFLMSKHLESNGAGADEVLRQLNVVDGFKGMDFGESLMFGDEDRSEIDIIVKYKVLLPLPINFLGDVDMVQRASARAWLGAKTPSGTSENNEEASISDLSPFERGKAIQDMYGRNLPYTFPVITKFENGMATSVHSINLNDKTYQSDGGTVNNSSVKYRINYYLKELYSFNGDSMTSDGKEYRVDGNDINRKQLIIVVPKGLSNESSTELYNSCRENAASTYNIDLVIKEL
jgi:hypothetical protein